MDPASTKPWPAVQLFLFRIGSLFVLLFMLTLSFPHPYIPDIPGLIAPVFEPIVKWIGDNVFGISRPYAHEILSDSTGLYIHLLILIAMAGAGALLWSAVDRKSKSYTGLFRFFLIIVTYYLAFHLLVYGFNKIFKWQFYLPEPNTLFTTVGSSHRDLLYWSTMGSSHSYNVFLGAVEILAAVLLFIRNTRLLGALFSFGVMLNIVMVNFSYDISVKIFSLFLLLLSIIIIIPNLRQLIGFFFRRQPSQAEDYFVPVPATKRRHYYLVKSILIIYLSGSVLSTYIQSGNFNDDNSPRPPFHGAYDVELFIRNEDTLAPLLTDDYRWRRVFIHRRGYLIIQNMRDKMKDFLFQADTVAHRWHIEDESTNEKAVFLYEQPDDSTILLNTKLAGDSVRLRLKKIDLSKLILFRKEFNWTMD